MSRIWRGLALGVALGVACLSFTPVGSSQAPSEPISSNEDLPLAPNPGPESVPPKPSWWPAILGGLAGLVLVAASVGAWLIWRRPKPALPLRADEWALQELERIAAQSARGQPKPDQPARVADVLRRYLSLRFQLPALQQTTPEFLTSVKESELLTVDQKRTLADFLSRSDLLKFAGVSPSDEETAGLLEAARRFVGETAPVPGER